MQSWILLLTALSMNSVANVLLKLGAKTPATPVVPAGFLHKVFTFLNLSTMLAMFFFACNVFIYRKALEEIQLSVAYPVMAGGGFFIVTLVSFLHPLLRERVSLIHIMGLVFILLGIIMVTKEI